MELKEELINLAKSAQTASRQLSSIPTLLKNNVLKSMADALLKERDAIKKANKKDLSIASKNGMSKAFIDRLRLSDERINNMSDSLLELTRLNDPVGKVIKSWARPNGLRLWDLRPGKPRRRLRKPENRLPRHRH